MIQYEQFTLDNGLRVVVHEDHIAPIAVVNIMYNVGSRDEDENKTGFAHLFEHLMFGGSKHIPSYDEPLQRVGGENNAFTSPDVTNYYISVPSQNIETAFWLESDRMLSLSFDQNVLDVQKSVVIEEFRQRYLNQPYGDVWLKLRPLAYTTHPYRWATIGKEIEHIEKATLEDLKDFFYRFYIPNNALMVVSGDVTVEQVKQLCKKWFEPIPAGKTYQRNLPQEPKQTAARSQTVSAQVPLTAIYKAYHIGSRFDADYYPTDLLSDILGRDKSSRLFTELVKKKELFNSISCYHLGSLEPGLMVVEGKINANVPQKEAEEAMNEVIENVVKNGVTEQELQKTKNQSESSLLFSEIELLNRSINLAYYALEGKPELINTEIEKISAVSVDEVNQVAQQIFKPENCSTLYYQAISNE